MLYEFKYNHICDLCIGWIKCMLPIPYNLSWRKVATESSQLFSVPASQAPFLAVMPLYTQCTASLGCNNIALLAKATAWLLKTHCLGYTMSPY